MLILTNIFTFNHTGRLVTLILLPLNVFKTAVSFNHALPVVALMPTRLAQSIRRCPFRNRAVPMVTLLLSKAVVCNQGVSEVTLDSVWYWQMPCLSAMR